MRVLSFILLITLMTVRVSFSQISSKCVDIDNKPVSYVNISVKGKEIGTVSDLKGNFKLNNSKISKSDILIISHINYDKVFIKVSDMSKPIQLVRKTEKLDEVVVSNKKKKIKEKIVGKKTTSGRVILSFTSKSLGTEVGRIIQVKRNKAYDVKDISFNVFDLGYKSTTFRINFYSIKNNKIELEKVNEKDIIKTITKKGLVTINVEDEYLSFESDFLVSIEWVNYVIDERIKKEERLINFSSAIFSGPFVHRNNINLNWIEQKTKFNVGLGIFLTVDSYKK